MHAGRVSEAAIVSFIGPCDVRRFTESQPQQRPQSIRGTAGQSIRGHDTLDHVGEHGGAWSVSQHDRDRCATVRATAERSLDIG